MDVPVSVCYFASLMTWRYVDRGTQTVRVCIRLWLCSETIPDARTPALCAGAHRMQTTLMCANAHCCVRIATLTACVNYVFSCVYTD